MVSAHLIGFGVLACPSASLETVQRWDNVLCRCCHMVCSWVLPWLPPTLVAHPAAPRGLLPLHCCFFAAAPSAAVGSAALSMAAPQIQPHDRCSVRVNSLVALIFHFTVVQVHPPNTHLTAPVLILY